ncbi:aspartyl-phosphate phosphatase Spo0E family protein [Bacillus sp. FJAT-42376]|uniref:aspartyl-phosphate phosphatase Spo0E family protein n=1 Tax=Bacillus sp. FJAT-42376 TaxID=2014076 RepID=UPI000F50C3B3|nr:aspartyl-phosphate phosphatase Spo0E family protein [Bacillus sp. FJAT-42376]AZB43051.1 aspartyl-phosphate phosphatase Spo0E family protein [Bacillus sp. FJAT-42376]
MTKKDLLKEIERKRQELNEIVYKNGMTSAVTIQSSQELDKMLYEYQQIILPGNSQRYACQ